MRRHLIGLALVVPAAVAVGVVLMRTGYVGAEDGPKPSAPRGAEAIPDRGTGAWTSAVDPKPLSGHVSKGLAWLAEHQNSDGGWGQGEEAAGMRGGGQSDTLRDKSNVADTCIAALALIRSGSTPKAGTYRDAVAKAVRFVEGSVEASDSQTISVTTVQGTRVQGKLGPNIDTFLASLLLAEVKGSMGDPAEDRRALSALDKVIGKIQRHQKADGSFEGGGWAPVLAEAICGKGINRARQNGANVPQEILANSENGAKLAASGFVVAAAPEILSADSDSGTAPRRRAGTPNRAGGRELVGREPGRDTPDGRDGRGDVLLEGRRRGRALRQGGEYRRPARLGQHPPGRGQAAPRRGQGDR